MSSASNAPRSPPASPAAQPRNHSANPHAPLNPSTLREAHTLSVSPDDRGSPLSRGAGADSPSPPGTGHSSPLLSPNEADKRSPYAQSARDGQGRGWFGGGAAEAARETTSLLRKPFEFVLGSAHEGPCDHGTFNAPLVSGAASLRSVDAADEDRGFFGSFTRGILSYGVRPTVPPSPENVLKPSKSM